MSIRIKRLYRPVIGWRWWLQCGEWIGSNGAVYIGTGRGRRTFRVGWEESYATAAEARARCIANLRAQLNTKESHA